MDRGHGSPYDRGAADSWYRRKCRPHKKDPLLGEITDLTQEEKIEYYKGYEANEAADNYKEY